MVFLFGCVFLIVGINFLLRNTKASYVYGIITLGNGVNLLLFSTADIRKNAYPFIERATGFVDPLPQALVLTAIVISFATLCFVIAVLKKMKQVEPEEKSL